MSRKDVGELASSTVLVGLSARLNGPVADVNPGLDPGMSSTNLIDVHIQPENMCPMGIGCKASMDHQPGKYGCIIGLGRFNNISLATSFTFYVSSLNSSKPQL